MTEEKVTNSLADFLHRHRDNRELLEGVVDAVEITSSEDPIKNPPYVFAFRVEPTLRNPHHERRYLFVSVPGISPLELVAGDEVKISLDVRSVFTYYSIKELANMTTGFVYIGKTACVERVRDK